VHTGEEGERSKASECGVDGMKSEDDFEVIAVTCAETDAAVKDFCRQITAHGTQAIIDGANDAGGFCGGFEAEDGGDVFGVDSGRGFGCGTEPQLEEGYGIVTAEAFFGCRKEDAGIEATKVNGLWVAGRVFILALFLVGHEAERCLGCILSGAGVGHIGRATTKFGDSKGHANATF
jgi:hypothetical protein